MTKETRVIDFSSIEKVGRRRVNVGDTRCTQDTDLYLLTTPDPSSNQELSKIINAIEIGCPRCKQETTAIIKNNEYHCQCGYQGELNLNTLVLQGRNVENTWESV